MHSITLKTSKHQELVDITEEIQKYATAENIQSGVIVIYNPHTTAGLTINEGADADVARDIIVNLARLVPRHGDYRHAEGNSDAHIKSSLLGASAQVLVENGQLMLGTWQKIFFAEFDGPRQRKVWVKCL